MARIVTSNDGGPIRTVIDGRRRHATGTFSCVKAGFRALPVESLSCEKTALQIAEVSSAVLEIMAQPHRLEMYLEGQSRPWIYFPDTLLRVEADLAQDLRDGIPFVQAATAWRPRKRLRGWQWVMLEVKSDTDRRSTDPAYLAKIRLAKRVYGRMGFQFHTIVQSFDIGKLPEAVSDVAFDSLAEVCSRDISAVVRSLSQTGGYGTYGVLSDLLGSGHAGRARLHALHVRRIISIDLASPLVPSTRVRLIDREDEC